MYDRLTNVHNINNLIWVWNGQDPTYYPGDEYVDIIGYDLYPDPQDSSSQKDTYDLMKTVTDTNKIIAMTENGSLLILTQPSTTVRAGLGSQPGTANSQSKTLSYQANIPRSTCGRRYITAKGC